MQVQHVTTAGALVQVIDILGDQCQSRDECFQQRDRQMRWIRLRSKDLHSPPFVPTPYQRRIAPERFGGRQFLGIKVFPQSGECMAVSHA